MTTLTRGLAALACSLLLSFSPIVQAQLGAPGGGGGAAGPAPDLSCTGRGADGKLSCGGLGLEETLDFCEDADGDLVCDDKDECPDTPPGLPVFMNGCHEMALSEDQPWVLRGVNFEFDRATLREESIPILEAAVTVLKNNPELLVAIDGHTDSRGSDAYNENLSRARAEAVHDYFVRQGVGADRLAFRGFGESRPIAPNSFDDGSDNPDGRAENRRVELNVLDLETFNAVKAEIAERRAQRQAEAARREAERARAAARKAEQEAEQAEEVEEADENAEGTDGAQPASPPEDEFDASEYLDFVEDDADTDSSSADSAETEAVDSDSAGDSESGETTETESPSFDESDYLEFLGDDASGSESTSEGTSENSDSQ